MHWTADDKTELQIKRLVNCDLQWLIRGQNNKQHDIIFLRKKTLIFITCHGIPENQTAFAHT